jgi:aralkylamine N-acetyltransferase
MIRYETGTQNVIWPELYALYDQVGLVAGLAAKQEYSSIRSAFEQSFRVVAAFDEGRLVGAGRLLSDGLCYGLIVDVGVLPSHQKRGIGKGIMQALLEGVPELRVYLTSTFGNESFYERLGFRKHKTAYALLPGPSPYVEPAAHEREDA